MKLVKQCIAITVLLAVGVAPGALGAERAGVAVHASGVDFLPNVDYSRANLTVSGNGIAFSRVVDRGGSLSIGTYDLEQRPLPDGVYKWRLELIPNQEAARELRAEALKSGGRVSNAWAAQSGSFAISGGRVVDPSLPEPAAPRQRAATHASPLPPVVPSAGAPSPGRSRDTDAAVGDRPDTEQRAARAAASPRPPASSAGLQQADRAGHERSDAAASALGASPEAALRAATNHEQPARPGSSPRARSDDGTNGRPRSQ